MRYKGRVVAVVDVIDIKVQMIDRMIKGRTPSNPELADRVVEELKEELHILRDMLSLED
jgi:hypothetical protein